MKRFPSLLRSPKLTSQIGVMAGTAIAVCFITGYISHAIQQPPWWFTWPSRPVNLYRLTQGVHVLTGLAAIPLVSAKLWSVYPKLFRWPPVRGIGQALERLALTVLVATALFQLFSGLLNIFRWYQPMGFFFTVAHYWTAWALAGALLVHLGLKLPLIRRALNTRPRREPAAGGLSRRGVLATLAATAGVVVVSFAGQTFRPLAAISVLAPRDPRVGSQGLPVNGAAVAAGVIADATDPEYRLDLQGPSGTRAFTLTELSAMTQHTVTLPITCVEGWSADATWTGVRIRDLVSLVGGDQNSQVSVMSLQKSGYNRSTLAPPHARDPLTLLALKINGETLNLDHGFPCRLIAPNRPGVMQTKWVNRLIVEQP